MTCVGFKAQDMFQIPKYFSLKEKDSTLFFSIVVDVTILNIVGLLFYDSKCLVFSI